MGEWHFWHMYRPFPAAFTCTHPMVNMTNNIYNLVSVDNVSRPTLALHSWQRARPWFLMKPRSASSLLHISQQKHSGCQVEPIA